MKHALMALAGFPISIFFKWSRPIRFAWRRIYYTSRLRADVRDMDYSVQCDGLVLVSGTKNISLGRYCRLGMDIELGTVGAGSIRIGENVRINRGGTITAYESVVIGDFTIIGEFVSLRDANHGVNRSEPMRFQTHSSASIKIGSDVWIGRGCCILSGVTIGDGAVIGANSVVTRDIAPFSIAAGSPAKVIRMRS